MPAAEIDLAAALRRSLADLKSAPARVTVVTHDDEDEDEYEDPAWIDPRDEYHHPED